MEGTAVQPRTDMPPSRSQLESLFNAHHQRVFQAAYRVTGNAADAEDVLQTVFARLMQLPDGAGMEPNAGGYLYRAAVNAALDVVRARGGRRLVPLELVRSDGMAAGAPDPERQHSQREAADRLRAALAKVPPRTAEMFVLKYVEGFDNREIAAMVGTSPSVVAVSLFRARGTVRRSFKRERQ